LKLNTDMKKYTQRELLEEGTWQNIKNSKVGKFVAGAGRLADYAVQKVAPEARQLYMTPINTVKGAYNAITGNTGAPGSMSDKLMDKIANGLQQKNWVLDQNSVPKNAGMFNNKQTYTVNITDLAGANGKKVTVDENGNIVLPANMRTATGPAPAATQTAQPQAPTTPPTQPQAQAAPQTQPQAQAAPRTRTRNRTQPRIQPRRRI
jgi:hypothetical protein